MILEKIIHKKYLLLAIHSQSSLKTEKLSPTGLIGRLTPKAFTVTKMVMMIF
jgi:hypothetical protein